MHNLLLKKLLTLCFAATLSEGSVVALLPSKNAHQHLLRILSMRKS
jgi:hypothetical protein